MKTNTTKTNFLAVIAITLALVSCQSNSYIVVSKQAIMNEKTGLIQGVKLDSTFKMYDKVKFENNMITKSKN